MLKDALQAFKQTAGAPYPDFVLKFLDDPKLSKEGRAVKLEAVLEQKNPIVFPEKEPMGVTYGTYILGKTPANLMQHEQMQRDWAVIRSNANPKEVILDYWPPTDTPIVVCFEGRPTPAEGMLVKHEMAHPNGGVSSEIVFMELLRGAHLPGELVAKAQVKLGRDGIVRERYFHPHDMNKIVGWMYIGVDGETICPRTAIKTVDLFADCEFDDATRSLISLGIATKSGRVYYAFDSREAEKTKNEWIQENVNTVLMDVPPGTICWDLAAKNETFQNFLQFVIGHECSKGCDDVIIHVDFPTDVGYIAPLLHLGMGVRIGTMKKFQFNIEYVDAYPTTLKDAKQHNAAWDAVAIWFHLGYYEYMIVERLLASGGNVNIKDMLRQNEQRHNDHYNAEIVPLLEEGPIKFVPTDPAVLEKFKPDAEGENQ